MDASLDSIFSECTANDCEKLLSQLQELLARTECDDGSIHTDHQGTAQFQYRNVTRPIKASKSIPGLGMSLQVDDIRRGNVLRIRIETDEKVPFLAIVSVDGTNYFLKHCNGGSKADNLFKIDDRKTDIFVSVVPSSLQLLKEYLEDRCSTQVEPQAPISPTLAHQLAQHEPPSTANNRQRRNKSPIGNRLRKSFPWTPSLLLAMIVVAIYFLYSNWSDIRRMAVRSVTPDWTTSMPLEEKAKQVLYRLYFLFRDVWTLLMRHDPLSKRQLTFLTTLDTKVSKKMSLYLTPQSVSLSNELHPCPVDCDRGNCRKDCVLSYKGGDIEADLERLIQLTEDTVHLADSLLFNPKDWEHRKSEFERKLRVVNKQHDSAALWLSTRWHRTWKDMAGEMHGE